ncbi:MAG: LysR family transcriptional regulator [Alphaproteobacteria bacterium]|nr:LysR family transcriptional regulator [Alphaproteobacteria bacterium]
MDLDKLRVFHAVAKAGSFTHAGEGLHLSQSAVSRQVSALEDSLGCTLFHRHARGLLLTEPGELLYRTANDVLSKLALTQKLLGDLQDRPQGPLRISTTVAFGSTWLTPRMPEFLALYPDIKVTLLTTDSEHDLLMGEADCAIRFMRPRQPDMVQRRLMQVHSHLYAAPRYLAEHGAPASVTDLDRHQLIVYGQDAQINPPIPDINWILGLGGGEKPRQPSLTINNVYGIFRAVRAGMGIGSLPDFLAEEATDLARVLPKVEAPELHAFFVYPEELRHSKRLIVFRDFILRKVAEARF